MKRQSTIALLIVAVCGVYGGAFARTPVTALAGGASGVSVEWQTAETTIGMTLANDTGRVVLLIHNESTDTTAAITIETALTVHGLAVADTTITLTTGTTILSGLFDPKLYNIQSGIDKDKIYVTVSGDAVSSVSLCAVALDSY